MLLLLSVSGLEVVVKKELRNGRIPGAALSVVDFEIGKDGLLGCWDVAFVMRGVGRYLKEVTVRRTVEKRWMRIRFVIVE